MKRHRLIIIGGGFAGLELAKGLINTYFDITILDKKNHHLFQPLLYQVASAALSPADISVPIREVFSKSKNINVHMQEVVAINKEERIIECSTGDKYQYDYLAIATGSKPFFYGNEQWKDNTSGLKTLEDALIIRNKILKSFEEREINNEGRLDIVIVGGGPTGVELAGAFAEITYNILINEYKSFDASLVKIYLIEGGDYILPSYSHSISIKAKKMLEDLGVEIILKDNVSAIGKDYIKVGKREIKSDNIIWAAGNRATKLIDTLKIKQDRSGRAYVEDDLSLKEYPEIFILGDAANFGEIPLPSIAPVANQQGAHLAKQLKSGKRKAFRYVDKGSMATIGKYKAVVEWKSLKSSGLFAWLLWSTVHIFYLINFKNKVVVSIQWVWALFFNKRGTRLIK